MAPNQPPVSRWRCPDCSREFGRTRQQHDCAPGLTIEEYFATGPPHERPVFDAVHAHLAQYDDLYVEPLAVGIFFKRRRTFAQLRPMRRWVALSMMLPRKIDDPRISRKVVDTGSSFYHVLNIAVPEQVDETVRGWLDEAYLSDS
ncbi:MAG: DUF5655 domain-containing protein [Chloroflexota bacterium]|nr:DUF5655 domain-containing protein [Chloroflexota bacterium]